MLSGIYQLLKLDLLEIYTLVTPSLRAAYHRIFNAENYDLYHTLRQNVMRKPAIGVSECFFLIPYQSCQVSRYSRVTHANQCLHMLTRRWIKISRRSIKVSQMVWTYKNSQFDQDYLVPSNLQMCKLIKTDRKLVKGTHSFT